MQETAGRCSASVFPLNIFILVSVIIIAKFGDLGAVWNGHADSKLPRVSAIKVHHQMVFFFSFLIIFLSNLSRKQQISSPSTKRSAASPTFCHPGILKTRSSSITEMQVKLGSIHCTHYFRALTK
jgi:hypothetical protein